MVDCCANPPYKFSSQLDWSALRISSLPQNQIDPPYAFVQQVGLIAAARN